MPMPIPSKIENSDDKEEDRPTGMVLNVPKKQVLLPVKPIQPLVNNANDDDKDSGFGSYKRKVDFGAL